MTSKDKNSWVDFSALKQNVSFITILEHYGLISQFKRKENHLVGACPIHKGDSLTAFHIDLVKNVYNCFTRCKSLGHKGGGNILDFVAEMENLGHHKEAIRQAARLIIEWTGSGAAGQPERAVSEAPKPPEEHQENKPLAFQLHLDPAHPYLIERELSLETIKTFGLGYCEKGMMKGRICIPIHDQFGNLIAYAGRALDEQIAKEEGRYKLPTNFHKSQVLFNFHRVSDRKTIILVEGYFDCFKVYQAGFPNVCALMGTAFSEFHERVVIENFKQAVLMFDNDPAGKQCAKDVLNRLYDRLFVRVIKLDNFANKTQPDQLSDIEIQSLLSTL